MGITKIVSKRIYEKISKMSALESKLHKAGIFLCLMVVSLVPRIVPGT